MDTIYQYDICLRPYPVGKQHPAELYRFQVPQTTELMNPIPLTPRPTYRLIKKTTFVNPPAERYSANANVALMDGKKGVVGDYYWQNWLGFNGDDMEAVIELKEPVDVNMVKIGVAHKPEGWVVWPKGAWVAFSKDGKKYTEWYPTEFPMFNKPDPMTSLGRVEARAKVDVKKVKFLKVKVENQGILPKWHPNAGEKAWIMVDEVRIEN
jgi:hexosaminidase